MQKSRFAFATYLNNFDARKNKAKTQASNYPKENGSPVLTEVSSAVDEPNVVGTYANATGGEGQFFKSIEKSVDICTVPENNSMKPPVSCG